MNKSAEYIQFEDGFLKVAEENGCDVTFLKGYIKEADEMVELWKNAFDQFEKESGDPQYKIKIASEIIRLTMMPINKQAGFMDSLNNVGRGFEGFTKGLGDSVGLSGTNGLQEKLQGWLGSGPGAMGSISKFLQSNPHMLTSLLTGAGGGGLAGLLIGALLKHPMAGMMLGGLAGAGGSAFMGNQNMRDSMMKHINPQPAEPIAKSPVPPPATPGASNKPPLTTPSAPIVPPPAKPIIPGKL